VRRTQGNLALSADGNMAETARSLDYPTGSEKTQVNPGWHGELAQRVDAYRARKRKLVPNASQPHLPFGEAAAKPAPNAAVAVGELPPPNKEDFSFTIAIGRPGKKRECDDTRILIDVTNPAGEIENPSADSSRAVSVGPAGLYPVASMDERRLAAVIDVAFLLFAYGGFLTLFGSLGGQFTLSKLSAVVYVTSFSMFYLQYFVLFTIFGGTTPGMMLRGLRVVNFSGETPTPRQMLLRSAGYLLSAGTFFLGFLWAMWDEDALTWHDRVSRTYLSAVETFADIESTSAAHGR
jgi:uncharacterized RDD family membrane protein YckC